MCLWKQWRKPRTRIRNLLQLGASKLHAIRTGLSSKGYWHLSRTLATQSGMTNEWFKELGLVSVRDIWIKVQGYDNTAPAPSGADPHAGWCGGGQEKTRLYPIMFILFVVCP